MPSELSHSEVSANLESCAQFARQLKLAGNLARSPVVVGGSGGGAGGGGGGGGGAGAGAGGAAGGEDGGPGGPIVDWEETDRFSFEDSDRFEEDSLCSWSSEPESLCNNWRGWRRPTVGFGNSKKTSEGKFHFPLSSKEKERKKKKKEMQCEYSYSQL